MLGSGSLFRLLLRRRKNVHLLRWQSHNLVVIKVVVLRNIERAYDGETLVELLLLGLKKI